MVPAGSDRSASTGSADDTTDDAALLAGLREGMSRG